MPNLSQANKKFNIKGLLKYAGAVFGSPLHQYAYLLSI